MCPREGSMSCRSHRLRSVDLASPQTRMALSPRPESDSREKDASLAGTDSALSLYPSQAYLPAFIAKKGENVPEISSHPLKHIQQKHLKLNTPKPEILIFTLETIPLVVYPTQNIVISSFHVLRAKVLKISLTTLSFISCIQPISQVLQVAV